MIKTNYRRHEFALGKLESKWLFIVNEEKLAFERLNGIAARCEFACGKLESKWHLTANEGRNKCEC